MDNFTTYDDNKIEDCFYLGEVKSNKYWKKYRKAEILFNADEMPLEKVREIDDIVKANIIEDVLLYKTESGQQKIQCWIEEYKEGMSITNGLRISRRTKNGVYSGQEVCLNLSSTIKLKKFLDRIFTVDFSSKNKQRIDLDQFLAMSSDFKTVKISLENFNDIMAYNIENLYNYENLVEILKRKHAILRLEEIVADETSYKNESDINVFLKKNIWLFNNEYVFFSKDNMINTQNILDLMPVTYDGYIDIIELKLPTVKIFNYDKSHNNYYPASKLTKAIAQCMNYIIEMEKLLLENNRFLKPKATIIIGSEEELTTEEKNFLRLLNSSYHNINICTYQQLIEKAKNSLSFMEKVKEN
jgi:hypothetical protein